MEEQADTMVDTAGADGWSTARWTPVGEWNPFVQN